MLPIIGPSIVPNFEAHKFGYKSYTSHTTNNGDVVCICYDTTTAYRVYK